LDDKPNNAGDIIQDLDDQVLGKNEIFHG